MNHSQTRRSLATALSVLTTLCACQSMPAGGDVAQVGLTRQQVQAELELAYCRGELDGGETGFVQPRPRSDVRCQSVLQAQVR